MLLGPPHVLQITRRAAALIELRFSDQPPEARRRLSLATALAEHCILPPAHLALGSDAAAGSSAAAVGAAGGGAAAGARCDRSTFEAAVSRLDPLRGDGGLPLDAQLLDLAWQLLRWEPERRLSAHAALRHPAVNQTSARAATWPSTWLRSI